jgi:hypothetical protein
VRFAQLVLAMLSLNMYRHEYVPNKVLFSEPKRFVLRPLPMPEKQYMVEQTKNLPPRTWIII